MQWINTVTSTGIGCSGVLLFSISCFAYLLMSTAEREKDTDHMVSRQSDGKMTKDIFSHFCSLLPAYTSLSAPPAILPSLPIWSPLISISIIILWRSPIPLPYSPSVIYFLPIPNPESILHIGFLCNCFQDSPQVSEKITTMPSLLHHVFWSEWYLHIFSAFLHILSHCPWGLPQRFTNPVSISTFYSQDIFNCSTEKIQSSVPPPPILAILLCMLPLLPPDPEEEGLLFSQFLHL